MRFSISKFHKYVDKSGNRVALVTIRKVNRYNNRVTLLVSDRYGNIGTCETSNLEVTAKGFIEGDLLVMNERSIKKADLTTVHTTYVSEDAPDATRRIIYLFQCDGTTADEIARINAIPSEYVMSSSWLDGEVVNLPSGRYKAITVKTTTSIHSDIELKCSELKTFVKSIEDNQ